jgi:hypothetical protein
LWARRKRPVREGFESVEPTKPVPDAPGSLESDSSSSAVCRACYPEQPRRSPRLREVYMLKILCPQHKPDKLSPCPATTPHTHACAEDSVDMPPAAPSISTPGSPAPVHHNNPITRPPARHCTCVCKKWGVRWYSANRTDQMIGQMHTINGLRCVWSPDDC